MALAAPRPLPDLSLLELPSSQDAQMHVLCRCARSLRSTRAPGLRWRRARFGLAKGCQQHQVKVMEGFGYTVASLPCSEHTHSHLAGQPSSGSGHLRPSGRSGRETTPRRARGPLAPAFRPSELRSVCPRPARRATGVARATLSSSGAPAQPAASTDAVSCRRPPKAARQVACGGWAATRWQGGCLPHPCGWSKADIIRGSGLLCACAPHAGLGRRAGVGGSGDR